MTTQRIELNPTLVGLEWFARLASIISIGLLISLFMGEGLNPSQISQREWVGLVFFPLGVVIGMFIAWWNEGVGAVFSILSLMGFYFVYGYLLNNHVGGWAFIMFTAPAFVFLLHWFLVRTVRNLRGRG